MHRDCITISSGKKQTHRVGPPTGAPTPTVLERWPSADLASRQLPARTGVVAGVAVGVLDQVVLMLGLGLPERPRGRELGDHLARPQTRGIHIGNGLLRRGQLLVRGVENGRPLRTAAVIALAPRC